MNPDPLSTNDAPMSYKDALIVALVITLTLTFTVFMVGHTYDVFTADPPRFIWDLVTFLGATYLTTWGSLTGLTIYATRVKERAQHGS